MLNTAQRKAYEILEFGVVQPMSTFYHLCPRHKHDFPWQHQQRVSIMLRRLQRYLDRVNSEWKLVRVSKRGQSGLYQLQKRPQRQDHVTEIFSKGSVFDSSKSET